VRPFLTSERLASQTLYFEADTQPEMQGFLSCVATAGYGTPFVMQAVPDIDRRIIMWRINGEPVAGQGRLNPRAPMGPGWAFEENTFEYQPVINIK
jgi:hypothetical protein